VASTQSALNRDYQLRQRSIAYRPVRHKQPLNISGVERIASLVGGGALAFYGLRASVRGNLGFGTFLTILGGTLAYRGVVGHSSLYRLLDIEQADDATASMLVVEKTVTINRPVSEIFPLWRDFNNLPRFMTHLQSVRVLDERRSHWIVNAPTGTVEWDAEITALRENEVIAWRAIDNADIEHEGSISFLPAPGNRGTEVRVYLKYAPPAGKLGAIIAKIFGEEPAQQIKEDLYHFKQMIEAGEIPTTDGQPAGRR
jgi:uncharacterized membrane protein